MKAQTSFSQKAAHVFQTIQHITLRPLAKCGWFFAYTQLMVYVIAVVGNMTDAHTNPFLSFLLPIFDCYLVCVIACLLKKIRLHWLWNILIAALLFAELFTEFFYKTNFTVYIIQLILETDSRESSEFISSALSHPATWKSLLLTVCTVIVAYILNRLAHRRFRYRQAVMFVVFGLIVWSGIRQLSAYTKLYRCFTSQSAAECLESENYPHMNSPFIRVSYGIAFNIASLAELEVLEKSVAATVVDSCSYRSPLIVLIIGESYNKHHSQLYGYNLPTTPRQVKHQEEGHLYPFSDAVSPFNLTSSVFKHMFTTWDEECTDDWTQHTLFTAIFKKAGYKVYFVTNQFVLSSNSDWDIAGGTIFNRPKLSKLQFTDRNLYAYAFDDQLLDEIPPLDTLTAAPTLLIFHMLGQHVQYEEKYPSDFARFSAKDEKTPFGGEEGKQMSAHYDNATYYNDFVVDSIFRMIKDTEAIAIYLSDHGEEIYDWRDHYERTGEETMPPEVAHYQYEIPMMFFMTDSFMSRHEDISAMVKAATDRPFFSTDLRHTLLFLAGIGHADYKEKFNLLSPNYDMHRRRIIRHEIDYDELIKNLKK